MKHFAPISLLLLLSLLAFGCTTPNNHYSFNSNKSLKNTQSRRTLPVVNLSSNDSGEISIVTPTEDSFTMTTRSIASSSTGIEEESGQNLLDTALDFCDAAQESWSEGKPEEAIEALDQAYNLVLSVDTEDNPKLIQQKEDLRFMISKRILEIYASRYTAVNGKYEAIPLVMNKHVEREIKLFQGRERKFFLESYRRSGRYREMMVKALNEAGMPEELSWLPLIESGFKIRALSSARALGLWQFIPSTGYKFGLKRDNWVDERLDPEKATAAAIAYMTELHNIFGDWSTVLAAYNCGEGRVLRVIRDQRINYLDNFWDLYEKLPRETARYVPRFLASLHILKNPKKFGFTKKELAKLDEPERYNLVTIDKTVQLKSVASVLGVPYDRITDLNPELRYKITSSKPYKLKVPAGISKTLLSKLDDIPKWYPPEKVYVYHKVRNGETLSLIASKYRSSIQKIVRANNIKKKHLIRVGQKLKIPLGSGTASTYIATSEIPSDGLYRVNKGDSLWLIARKFNTNTKTLQRINNLKTTRLKIGQVLKVANVPLQLLANTKYRVKKGDSLWLIAKKFNTDTKKLQRINNLNTTKLQVGQVLKIKK